MNPCYLVTPVTKGVTVAWTPNTAVTDPRDGSWSCFSCLHARDGDVLVLCVCTLILTPVTRTHDHPCWSFLSSHGRDGVLMLLYVVLFCCSRPWHPCWSSLRPSFTPVTSSLLLSFLVTPVHTHTHAHILLVTPVTNMLEAHHDRDELPYSKLVVLLCFLVLYISMLYVVYVCIYAYVKHMLACISMLDDVLCLIIYMYI